MMMIKYSYPVSRLYNETVATLADGRTVTVNTQYESVFSHRHLSDGCGAMVRMGGRCDCGALDGIDIPALVADARANGLFGTTPKPEMTPEQIDTWRREEAEYERSRRSIEDAMTLGGRSF